jgi:hypothetical protein
MKEEIRKTFYENGNIETERTFVDGVEHGPAKGWFESGELEFEAFKENGLVQGLVKNYYKNGILRIETNYIDQVKEGEEKLYYDNGQLAELRNYKDEGWSGKVERRYNEDGALIYEREKKDSETEIIPPEIKKLKKGSKCTVFLTNSKEHLLVIFKATYDEDYIDEVLGHTGAKDIIDGYDTIVNLTEDESIDISKYPPVLIECSSQSVLKILHHYMPEKKFVLVYSWYDIEDHEDYETYLETLYCKAMDDEGVYHPSLATKIEVVDHIHEIFITDRNVHDELPGKKILKFPGSSTMEIAEEYGLGGAFDYDNLSIFEEEVFNHLTVENVEGDTEYLFKDFFEAEETIEQYEQAAFPRASKLILDVEKYKSKVILKH